MSSQAPPGAIEAGNAAVRLYLNDTAFTKGLSKAKTGLETFSNNANRAGRAMMTVGAAASAAIGGSVLAAAKVFADAGSALNDMSQRTGIAVDQLSRLGHAANMSGTSLGTVEAGIKAMQKALYAADEESRAVQETLKNLGVSMSDLSGLSPDQQFMKIADALSRISDPTRRAALSMKLFSGAGQELVPLLSQGSAEIQRLMNEADRLGVTMDQKTAAAASELGDAFNRMKAVGEGLSMTLAASMAPAVTELAGKIQSYAPMITGWIKAHADLISSTGSVAVSLTAYGTALMGLSKAAGLASTTISKLPALVELVAGNLRKITLAALIAGFQAMARAEFQASDAMKALNYELERSIRLTDKLNQVHDRKADKALQRAEDEANPFEKRNIIKAELEEQQKLLAGQRATERAAGEKLGADSTWWNTAIDYTWGSGTLKEDRQTLTNAASEANATEDRVKRLQDALAELDKENPLVAKVAEGGMIGNDELKHAWSSFTGTDTGKQVQPAIDGISETFGKMFDSVKEAAAKAKQREADIQRSIESVTEAMMTPQEKLQARLKELDQLKANGLDDVTYERAVKQAKLEAGQAAGQQGLSELDNRARHAGAAEKGSQEALSAIAKAMTGSNPAEEEIADNTREQVKLLRKMTTAQKTMDKLTIVEMNIV